MILVTDLCCYAVLLAWLDGTVLEGERCYKELYVEEISRVWGTW